MRRRSMPTRRSDRVFSIQAKRQAFSSGGDRASRAAAGVFLPTRGERPGVERSTEAPSAGVFPGRTNQPERRLLSGRRPGVFVGRVLRGASVSMTKHRAITDDRCPFVKPRGESSAGDSGRRSKNGGPLTLALSPGGEGMKGRPASFCRQFGRSDVVFAGQSVVFPKVVCYIGEGQRHNSFRNFRKAATLFLADPSAARCPTLRGMAVGTIAGQIPAPPV